MDSKKLIVLLFLVGLIGKKGQAQSIEIALPPLSKHIIGIHIPVSRGFGVAQGNTHTAFSNYKYSNGSGSTNSSLGAHYFRVFPSQMAVGIRASWHHANFGGKNKINQNLTNVFETLLCIRYLSNDDQTGLLLEFSGGPHFTSRMEINPSYYDYANPYPLYGWFRGAVGNFKIGGMNGNTFGHLRFAYGFQTGYTSFKAHRMEFQMPAQTLYSWSSSFSGIHLGFFLELSGLW
jgi:hypothetical protein